MPERLVPPNNERWISLGTITIDCGRAIIGDPFHIHKMTKGKWDEFADKIGEFEHFKQINEAVVFKTGWGDGDYEVFGKIQHGKLTEIRINFKSSPNEDIA